MPHMSEYVRHVAYMGLQGINRTSRICPNAQSRTYSIYAIYTFIKAYIAAYPSIIDMYDNTGYVSVYGCVSYFIGTSRTRCISQDLMGLITQRPYIQAYFTLNPDIKYMSDMSDLSVDRTEDGTSYFRLVRVNRQYDLSAGGYKVYIVINRT